jgi:RNA polymerase sigma factor (sigma-70 family)
MVEKAKHPSRPDKEQLEKLFQDNYGLLVSQAISFRPRTQSELDDYIQIAAIGMMKACQGYDETKAKFSTYAVSCIRNALKNHLRKESKPRPLSTANMDDHKTYIKESLYEVLPSSLTKLEKECLYMMLEGHTYNEIAKDYGLSKQQIQTIVYNSYRKIRKANDI